MSRYVVTLVASFSRDVSVNAESPQEAVKLAERQRTHVLSADRVPLKADGVERICLAQNEAWDVIGRCEGCEVLLLEPLDHPLDERRSVSKGLSVAVGLEEGGYLCRPCADGAAEAERRGGNGA